MSKHSPFTKSLEPAPQRVLTNVSIKNNLRIKVDLGTDYAPSHNQKPLRFTILPVPFRMFQNPKIRNAETTKSSKYLTQCHWICGVIYIFFTAFLFSMFCKPQFKAF